MYSLLHFSGGIYSYHCALHVSSLLLLILLLKSGLKSRYRIVSTVWLLQLEVLTFCGRPMFFGGGDIQSVSKGGTMVMCSQYSDSLQWRHMLVSREVLQKHHVTATRVLQHVISIGSKEQCVARMMVLWNVNNIGSKKQYMSIMMVLWYFNNNGSKDQRMATKWSYKMSITLAVRNTIWQQR